MIKKQTKSLNIQVGTPEGETLIDWLLEFRFDDFVTCCPLRSPRDFRTKEQYSESEQKILNLLWNVDCCSDPFCPTVCSGLRGDGSWYREACKFFGGYGKEKEMIWSFFQPQEFLYCSKVKGSVIATKKLTICKRRRLARMIAAHKRLIIEWGSANLCYVPNVECKQCKFWTGKSCNYEIKCKCAKEEKLYCVSLRLFPCQDPTCLEEK